MAGWLSAPRLPAGAKHSPAERQTRGSLGCGARRITAPAWQRSVRSGVSERPHHTWMCGSRSAAQARSKRDSARVAAGAAARA
jgi:hypothetical protein